MGEPCAASLDRMPLEEILRKRKALKRQLAARPGLTELRVALLGGSTLGELADLLELRLLDAGFHPILYQSGYGRYYEEAVEDSAALLAFRPHAVLVLPSVRDLGAWPPVNATEAELAASVGDELARLERIWQALERKLDCVVIQNNFEFPPEAVLGNLDAVHAGGRMRFVAELNCAIARAAAGSGGRVLLQDVCRLAAETGLARWFDAERWFSYKIATTPAGSDAQARSLTAMLGAVYGRTRKVLVLDLDNTVWGGVIGDDGPGGIRLGRESPLGEAYTAFGEYCLRLRQRGILLAACSKNDDDVAREGLRHPDAVLREEHFAAIRANWEPKPGNLASIARELNLGLESFVFVDDNPAERELVRAQLPAVAVPEMGDDVTRFAGILEAGRYFEAVSLSREDVARAALYQHQATRAACAAQFASYGEYLDSLEMSAEIEPFKPIYAERIAQLTNKTNQFNLTLRRYTVAEIQAVTTDRAFIGLYGRLADRFGDHGLVSVLLGHREGTVLTLDLWLMSCRVLKRDMEHAMLDALVERARDAGITAIRGLYRPGPKNALVAEHYLSLGFIPEGDQPDGTKLYTLGTAAHRTLNHHIRVAELATTSHAP